MPQGTIATGESRLDAFINKAQKEIAGLREDIKKNPADVNLRLKEEEKTKVLNNLLSMKRNWAVTGATSIPLIFKAQWTTAKQSLNQAKTKAQALANAGSTETYVQAKKNAKSEYIKAVQAEKDARKGSNAAWEKANEDLEAKKKIYEKYWGSISRANKKASTNAKKDADRQRKAQEELNNRLKALQQKNTDETISLMQEGTEKKLAEIKNDYAKRKAEIDNQEAEFKKKNKEAGKKEALTSAQSEALTKARDLATQEYNKKLDEVNMEALTSMRDYLKEYGSLYQQKQAIAEEYEEKIAKAQTEGEKLSLKQENADTFKAIDNYLEKGIRPKNDEFIFEKVPEILKAANVSENEIVIKTSIINKAKNEHSISDEEIKDSIKNIASPVLVFNSDKTTTENKKESFLCLTDTFAENGKPIAFSMNLDSDYEKSRSILNVNQITSIHDRTLIAKNGTDLIQKWTENGLCRYVDDKKISEWSKAAGVQFPIAVLQSDKTNILSESNIVNGR